MNQARIYQIRNSKIRDGATTIPKGSTLQANGSGSAGHLFGDDDIVCSAWKHAAALIGGVGLAILHEHMDDQVALNVGPMNSDIRSKSCELRETPNYEYAIAA